MKTLLSAALIALSAVSSWSQGVVQFQNGQITFTTVADRRVFFDCDHLIPLVGTNYAAALWYVPGADQNIMSPTAGTQAGALAFFRPSTTTSPGIWANPGSAGNTRILDGVAIGETATLQVRVWDSVKYGSFAQAFAAGEYGWSSPFNQRMPDFAHGEPATAAYMEGLRAFPLCPEPSQSRSACWPAGPGGFHVVARRIDRVVTRWAGCGSLDI